MATLRNGRNGALLASDVEIAAGLWARAKGLLGRDGLPDGHGLYLNDCQSIHSFFMRFPFDALFVDKEWHVLHLISAMPANRASRHVWRAKGIFELPAGVIQATDTHLGDTLEFSRT